MVDLSIKPITEGLGVFVNISAEELMSDAVAQHCMTLLNEHGVLVFPQIGLSDEDQVAFSNKLGEMKTSRLGGLADTKAANAAIYPVSLDPKRSKFIDYIESNAYWHIDGTSYEVPPKATNLKCEVPPSSGGDTEFANVFAAYDALPDAKKAQLESLRVIHSVEAANRKTHKNPSQEDIHRWRETGPDLEHPLVWKQKDGRKSLVIGSSADYIVGMELDAGRALLDELLEWCTQPQFCYRHQWKKGDMVIWNNYGLLHRAHHYTLDSGRLMHRTTIMGREAFA